MTNTVAVITDTITPDALWGTVGTVMPIVVVTVLFALGFRMVKNSLQGTSKAKAKV